MWEASVASKGGALYLLSFIDNFSIKDWFYMLKKKSNTFFWWEIREKGKLSVVKLIIEGSIP